MNWMTFSESVKEIRIFSVGFSSSALKRLYRKSPKGNCSTTIPASGIDLE